MDTLMRIREYNDTDNIITIINEMFDGQVIKSIDNRMIPLSYNEFDSVLYTIEIITDTVDKNDIRDEILFMKIDTPGTEIHIFIDDNLVGVGYWESWYDGCFPNAAFLYDVNACKKYVRSYENKIFTKLTNAVKKYGLESDYQREDYGGNEWGTNHFWAY